MTELFREIQCNCDCDNAETKCDCHKFVTECLSFKDDMAKITQNCIWQINKEARFTYLTGKVVEMAGVPGKKLIGEYAPIFFTLSDKKTPFEEKFWQLFREEKPIVDLHLYTEATNSHLLVNAAPYYSDDKELVGYRGITRVINQRVEIEENLRQSNLELKNKNIALREVLSQLETEKKSIHQNLAANVEKFIKPLLGSLKNSSNLTPTQMKTVDSIEQLLNELNWDFFRKLDHLGLCLTPAELQVCRLIQSRYSIKEIAGIQSISLETAKTHCKNIRRKIGLKGRKTSLASFFQQL